MHLKKVALLVATSLLLVGCNNNGTSSSSIINSSTSSSTSSSNEDILPNIDVFYSITDIFAYLETDGLDLEVENGVSFEKNMSQFEQTQYSSTTISDVSSGTSYFDTTLTVNGTQTTTRNNGVNETTQKDNYKGITTLLDNKIYSIVDFENGKENDYATSVDFTSSMSNYLLELTSVNAASTLLSYYDTYLSDQIIKGFDDIEPTIDTTNGSFSYQINQSWTKTISSIDFGFVCNIDILFDKDGNLLEFDFEYSEHQFIIDEVTGDTTEESFVIYSINDNTTVTLGTKQTYNNDFLNPLDYFMTDFVPAIYAYEVSGETPILQDNDSIAYDRYLIAQVKEVTPINALDTDLTISASSNSNVIRVSNGIASSVGEGTTTLTITNENKTISKTLQVTVKAPSMERIEAKIYSQYHYLNDTEDIYVTVYPDNTLDSFEIINNTPETAKLNGPDENNYYSVTNIALGDVKLTVRCVNNPDISTTIEYEVIEQKSKEEVIANLIGTWYGPMLDQNNENYIENAAKIEFFDDNSGQFTCQSDNTGMLFVPNQPYQFTWSVNENSSYTDRVEILISEITVDWTVYDYNTMWLWLDGKSAYLQLTCTDFFGANVLSDLVKE